MLHVLSFYLLWIVIAFGIGVLTGLWTWSNKAKGAWYSGWLGWGIPLFVVGVIAAALKLLPGRQGLYLELALLLFAAFIIGCWFGGLLRALFAPARQGDVAKGEANAATIPAPQTVSTDPATGQGASTAQGAVTGAAAMSAAVAAAASKSRTDSAADGTPASAKPPASTQENAGSDGSKPQDGRAGVSQNGPVTEVSASPAAASSAAAGKSGAASQAGVIPAGVTPAVAASAAASSTSQPVAFTAPAGVKPDDLKRIKGVGKKLEERLNALGVISFSQIAAWSPSDVDAVDEHLSFHGRIAREDWIGQAKQLAAGQETEFSKRVDKGEVASSSNEDTKQ